MACKPTPARVVVQARPPQVLTNRIPAGIGGPSCAPPPASSSLPQNSWRSRCHARRLAQGLHQIAMHRCAGSFPHRNRCTLWHRALCSPGYDIVTPHVPPQPLLHTADACGSPGAPSSRCRFCVLHRLPVGAAASAAVMASIFHAAPHSSHLSHSEQSEAAQLTQWPTW